MQALRRWNPAAVRTVNEPATCVAEGNIHGLPVTPTSDKDIAFCFEFAAHGGVATYAQGVKPGSELLRMEHVGLLDLVREPGPQLSVVRVSLSAAARDLLSGQRPKSTTAPQLVEAGSSRRNGFEVARGMIGAAIKAEMACGMTGLDPQRIAALEARLLSRVGQVQAPF